MVHVALRSDASWDHVVVICHNISINQGTYQHLKNNFKGKVDFVPGLPDTQETEDDLMNLLRGDPKSEAKACDS